MDMCEQKSRLQADDTLQGVHSIWQGHVVEDILSEDDVAALRHHLDPRQVGQVRLDELHLGKPPEVDGQAEGGDVHADIGNQGMLLQEVLHPRHIAAADVQEGPNVGKPRHQLVQGIYRQPRHGMPWIGTRAAEGAKAAEEVRVVDCAESIVLVLQRDHVGPPLCCHIHVALEGQHHWQLEKLKVSLDEARMLLCPGHLVVSFDTLITRLQMLVLDDAAILHDHILTDLVAKVGPLLHVFTDDLERVPHNQVVWYREHLSPLGAAVTSHRQPTGAEKVLAHRGVHEGKRLHRLLLIEQRDEETLPEAPFAVELL
mmetsp:Transcript_73675/g.172871  ORF Transcript_73675/g.172871 Transcript_73675/m.172871 type:complete len:314 (+) Transcript_73675:1199-2140(+)